MGAANESEACKTARAKSGEIMKAMNEANQKMDMYEKVENAKPGDLRAGMQITVTAPASSASSPAAPAMIGANLQDISSRPKFAAASIQARENLSPTNSMPMPAAPAALIK